MTDWVERLPRRQTKTVDLLAMTDLDRLPLSSPSPIQGEGTLNSFTNNDNIMNYEETSSLF